MSGQPDSDEGDRDLEFGHAIDHEAIVHEILVRLQADRARGAISPLPTYLDLWPAHPRLVAEEYAAAIREIQADPSDPSERTVAGSPRIGPFVIERELGRGGQGVVYLARDSRLPRQVALKVLHHAFLDPSSQSYARFRREAEALSKLDLPGIASVLEVGTGAGLAWMAMRYVAGVTLAEHLRKEEAGRTTAASHSSASRRAKLEATLQLVESVARTLHLAHEAGVVHRDIKPGNIILAEPEPVLVDFGLARDESEVSLTATGDVLGTPAYMAPEQCSGDSRPTDRRADVYGLGVTLYEALTGTRPFAGATREAILHAVRSRIFPPLRRTAPELPRDLEVVVHTAMNFEPTLRYETALAFAEDLRRVRDWEPILAEPPSVLGRIGRWSKRHPARAALIALIGIGTPTLAALGGYIAATAPRVAAQERTERARDFENEVESGFFDLAHHSLESAHTHFESALALVRRYPESGSAIEAELGRILVLRRGHRIAEAQAAWRTLRVDIGDPGLIAAMETELGLTPAADAATDSAGMLRPSTSLGHFMVATLALASGHENERERDANRHFQRARDHYLAAILQSDRARRAHHTGLADATSHLAMEVEARELSDTLLSLWPNDPQVTYAAGHALVNVDPKRAAAQLEQAVLNLPDASHAAFALGDARRKLGDASGAIAAYELGLTRQATYPNAWAALALANLAQKEAERAESAIRRALELAPDTPGFDSILAKTFDMRRDDDAAAAILVASLDRHPGDWRNRHTLGQAFRRLDRSEDAARELLLAAQHPHASAECLINTGLAIQECGRPIEATPYLVRGHDLGSARPTWNYPSGQWLQDNQRYAAQDRHFSEKLAEATSPETLDIEDRELVHFNEWALFTRRPEVGLRFYRELFRNRPSLVAKEAYRATLVLLVLRGATFSITNPYVRTPKLATLSAEDRREALGWLEAMVDQWESPAENMEPFPDSIPETAAWLGDETAFQALRDGGESQLDSALQARTAALWARISAAAEKK